MHHSPLVDHCNHLPFLTRLLNVVAYNAPDAPYVPLLHPVAGLLLEAGLNEEEVNTSKRSGAKLESNFILGKRSTRLAASY